MESPRDQFAIVSFQHIYRELNKKEIWLSKEAILNLLEGILCIVKETEGASLPTKVIPLFFLTVVQLADSS